MSIGKTRIESILNGQLPVEIVGHIVDEYIHIKEQFFLNKFQPTELDGGRFGESVLRAIEYINIGNYTPFGQKINSEGIIKAAENNTSLKETIRFFIPRANRVLIDVRNKRDVGHPGGDVSPNFSDSSFIIHSSDWILTELIRHFYNCSIDEASKIVKDINEVKIPIIYDIDGFIRVQNTQLSTPNKIMMILYYKKPVAVKDLDIQKWLRYKNASDFKRILMKMDKDSFIHYENKQCLLLPKGSLYIETNVPANLFI
jgi:hypothetical protein